LLEHCSVHSLVLKDCDQVRDWRVFPASESRRCFAVDGTIRALVCLKLLLHPDTVMIEHPFVGELHDISPFPGLAGPRRRDEVRFALAINGLWAIVDETGISLGRSDQCHVCRDRSDGSLGSRGSAGRRTREGIDMGLADDISSKVKDYLDGDYDVTEANVIPSAKDVAFGKVAKKMPLCVFSIDLRQSTNLLFSHNKQTAGKIHKSFLYAVSAVVKDNLGQIRSFNGDSLLAFWPAFKKYQINACVFAAMSVKWLLDVALSPLFEKYEKLDFGIGVDLGEVFMVRAGLSGDADNNDLVFMGQCVNFAVAVGEQAQAPYHVGISPAVYNNLGDFLIHGTEYGRTVDIWRDGTVKWQGNAYPAKATSWVRHF